MIDDVLFVAIDPGTTGFVTVCLNGKYTFKQIPIEDSKLDSWALFNFLSSFDYDHPELIDVCIYIEDVHSIFGMSAKSNFSFGEVYGGIKATVRCSLGKFNLVQPKEWQKEMHKGIEKNKDKKVMSLQAAQKLFSDMDFKRTERCTTPDHNLIDSLLICEYGKRKYYENK